MKVLSLFASPRPGGFSTLIHKIFVERLEKTGASVTTLRVSDLAVSPCTACAYCRTHESCIIRDEMDRLYSLFRESDIISISSPIYFSSLPAGLKAIIERCQVFWEERERGEPALSGKRGSLILTGGGDYRDMFTPSILTLRHLFNSTGVEYDESRYLLLAHTDTFSSLPEEIVVRAGKLAEYFVSASD